MPGPGAAFRTEFIARLLQDFHFLHGEPIDTVRVAGGALHPSLGLEGALVGAASMLPARLTVDASVVGRGGHGWSGHAAAFAAPRTMTGLLVGFYDADVLRAIAADYPMLNAVDVLCNRLAGLLVEAVLVHAIAHDAAGGVVAVAWSAMAWDASIGGRHGEAPGR